MPSGPNYLLFSDVDRLANALWDRSEVGWSPTPHAPVLGAPQRALDRNLCQIMAKRGIAQRTLGDVSYSGSGGVGDCTRPVPTPRDLRGTSGPRIDRIPSTRPPWRDRQYRDIKKLIFLVPSKCPIDRFELVSNRTVLKRLHAVPSFC